MKTKPHENPHCSCAPCEKWRQWVEGEEDGWRPSTGDEEWYATWWAPTVKRVLDNQKTVWTHPNGKLYQSRTRDG